ncbi:conserved membrane hypothetical protein [Microbacterium sp. 8M]|uniref:ABC transporter n=1 Tax=Microbacterium sp. 8M TaxID=2653153 RepID=UPI0012F184F1|nr:ABC transporter [Microbacterium sp. 8M]VXB70470.1 conserved membrane hypothetical protein [Microbacterium sp. 8M]
MSDHEVSKPAQAHDVDDAVAAAPEQDAQGAAGTPDAERAAQDTSAAAAEDAPTSQADAETVAPDHAAVAQSANASLAEAERAAADATAPATDAAPQTSAADRRPDADPDLAAFEEAEAAYPGTFGGTFTPPPAGATAETTVLENATTRPETADDARTQVLAPPPAAVAAPTAVVEAPPIFVQAPEPPRERGNRGAIFGIGLLAAIAFAILYLGTALGIAAIEGNFTTADSVVPVLLDHLRSAGLWVPVAAFAVGFWLLGGIINRGRWGFWVVFGIIVGAFAYGGHVLGAIGSVEFWKLGGSEIAGLANAQLLSPLAIAAFIFGRELTIWFGAWAARTGARRTAQNEEAQREYERVLEAGPQLP